MIKFFDYFDDLNDTINSSVPFMIFPRVIGDSRGSFSEVLKIESDDLQNVLFMKDSCSWIKQINRSTSLPGIIRGCHAQKGKFCQAKFVESLTEELVDMITDSRPESKTFGLTSFFKLNPVIQNKLFVPRGFLHTFIVPKSANTDAIFNYYCDNVYDKSSDISINPKTILQYLDLNSIRDDIDILIDSESNRFEYESYTYSEKDLNGLNYNDWMVSIKNDYEKNNISWWK